MKFVTLDSNNKVNAVMESATSETVEVEDNDSRYVEWLTAYNSEDYKRKRMAEYPTIADQLDKIYHDGIDAWKADIKVVKDKYPKS
tara:strand:+ start:1140 stop:1397 length:258 start_codon:yes stop_codon:yes gene_type:complete